MAIVEIFKWGKVSGGRPPRASGEGVKLYPYMIRIRYNDATDAFLVEESVNDVSYTTVANSSAISASEAEWIKAGIKSTYTACQGTTLVEFTSSTTFPYAVKTTTPNSPFCPLGGTPPTSNELFVDLDVFDETLPGASDGKLIANVNSLKPVVLYQITRPDGSQLDQSSNTFTGLAPGEYSLLIVLQGQGVEQGRRFSFTIAPGNFDDYGLFAKGEFDSDLLGHAYSIEIYKKDYEGQVREECLAGDVPAQLSYKGSSSEFISSYLYGLVLDFSLVARELRDWSVLYTQDEREYLVKAKKNGSPVFTGYLLPEFLDQTYYDGNHYAKLVATDGVGQLREYDFLRPDGSRYSGQISVQNLLETCLNKVNLNIPVYNLIRWSPDYTSEDIDFSNNVLNSITVDAGLFYILFDSPKCEDVLTTLCIGFGGATLLQANGIFLFYTPLQEFSTETVTAAGLLSNLTVDKISLSGSKSELLSGAADNVLVTLESGIGIHPGVEKISLTEVLQPIAGLVKNSNLQDYDKYRTDAATQRKVEVKDWFLSDTVVFPYFTSVLPRIATGNPTSGAIRTEYANENGIPPTGIVNDGMVFRDIRTQGSQVKYVKADLGFINREAQEVVSSAKELSFLIYLKVHCKSIDSLVAFKIEIAWQANSGITYYVNEDNTAWVQNQTQRVYRINTDSQEQDLEISFTTPTLPVGASGSPPMSGGMSIRLSEPYLFRLDSKGNVVAGDPNKLLIIASMPVGFQPRQGTGPNTRTNLLGIRAAQVKPLVGGFELPKTKTRSFTNTGKYTTQKVEITQNLGSHYYGKNNTRFYPYALRDSATNQALTYWRDSEGDVFEFSELTHRALIRMRQIPREIIRAVLRGEFVFYQLLKLSQDTGKEYFCTDAVYDLKTDTVTGTFVFASGSFIAYVLRINEDGTLKQLESGGVQIRALEKKYQYDEDFTTI